MRKLWWESQTETVRLAERGQLWTLPVAQTEADLKGFKS